MSLQKLTFRKLPTQQNLTASNTNEVLDLIYSGLASSVYADGTPRSTGVSYAWTPNREVAGGVTVALHCSPPSSGAALNQRVLFAGASSRPSPSPTMLRDTFIENTIYVGISKFSSVYSGYNQTTPFATGVFGGYSQFIASGSLKNSQVDYINIWESPETFMVQCLTAPDSTYNNAVTNGMAYCGAICDPESTNTTVDGETDGRLYGIAVGGNFSGVGGNTSNMLYTGQGFGIANSVTPSASYFYSWDTTVATTNTSSPLTYCLVPGSGAFGSQALFSAALNTTAATNGSLTITRSNSRGQIPVLLMNNRTATFSANFVQPSFLGRARETDICLGRFANDIVIRDSGNNVLGYSISTSRNSSTSVSVFLPYA